MKFVVPVLMFVLLSAPSVKLLMQARREPGGPEGWAGVFFFAVGAGMPLRMMGVTLMADGHPYGVAANVAGHGFLFIASLSLTIFTWQVFHPDSKRVRAIVAALIALQVGTSLAVFAGGAAPSEDSVAIIATNSMRTLPTVWACVESIRYWRIMRRRVSLGIADPVVANRFALWGVWTAAFAALPATALVLRIVLPMTLGETASPTEMAQVQNSVMPALRALMGSAALLGLIALVLSFFPPAWYLTRLRADRDVASA